MLKYVSWKLVDFKSIPYRVEKTEIYREESAGCKLDFAMH